VATYTDDFNRASLGTLAPNGATYTNQTNWEIVASTVVANDLSYGGNWAHLLFDCGAADYSVQGDITSAAGSDNFGVMGRFSDINNWVGVLGNGSNGNVYLQARIAGVDTVWGFYNNVTVPASLRMDVTGNSYDAYADGNLLGSYVDGTNFNLTAQNVGLTTFLSATEFDNLTVTTAAVPPEVSTGLIEMFGPDPSFPPTVATGIITVVSGVVSLALLEPAMGYGVAGATREGYDFPPGETPGPPVQVPRTLLPLPPAPDPVVVPLPPWIPVAGEPYRSGDEYDPTVEGD
jgi:hypothetical protein